MEEFFIIGDGWQGRLYDYSSTPFFPTRKFSLHYWIGDLFDCAVFKRPEDVEQFMDLLDEQYSDFPENVVWIGDDATTEMLTDGE